MKKIYLVLSLLIFFTNNAFSEVLLSRCYKGEYGFYSKYYEKWNVEISSNKLGAREVLVLTDWGWADKKKEDQHLNSIFNEETPRIKVTNYQITFKDFDYIQAKKEDREYFGATIKLFVDLKNKTYSREMNFYKDDMKYLNGVEKFKCEKKNEQSATDSSKSGPSSGSAFFINNKGNIVTNNHVVNKCNGPIKVLYNKKEYSAKVIAKDGNLDLAVLSSDTKPNQYLKLSKKSGDKLDRVVAAGYPLGYKISDELKLTAGIVSSTIGWKDNINQFQIDAALNPGNSGGPVVNDAGNLFGVAVAGLTDRQNLNFAIKSKAVKDFLDVNKVSYSTATIEFDMDNKKRLKLLEDSTVFIYCN
jgi:S1-C subfamily serine protease